MIEFLKTIKIDYSRILELLISGIFIFLFYLYQKRRERKAKEKETRFNLFETKKIEAILSFINAYNTVAPILQDGLNLTANADINQDKVSKFSEKVEQPYNTFYSSYNSILFFLEEKAALPFAAILLNTKEYYDCIQHTLWKHLNKEDVPLEPINLLDIATKAYTQNQDMILFIGKYARDLVEMKNK